MAVTPRIQARSRWLIFFRNSNGSAPITDKPAGKTRTAHGPHTRAARKARGILKDVGASPTPVLAAAQGMKKTFHRAWIAPLHRRVGHAGNGVRKDRRGRPPPTSWPSAGWISIPSGLSRLRPQPARARMEPMPTRLKMVFSVNVMAFNAGTLPAFMKYKMMT